MKNANNFR